MKKRPLVFTLSVLIFLVMSGCGGSSYYDRGIKIEKSGGGWFGSLNQSDTDNRSEGS